MRRLALSALVASLLIALSALAGPTGPTPASTAAAAPSPAERDGLLRLVPAETTLVWQRVPTPGGALLEDYARGIADAVAALQLDELLLAGVAATGAPEELQAELAGLRNVVVTVGATLPWDDLLASEVLYAETLSPGWTPDLPLPSMIVALRPPASRAADVERSLAGLLGTLTGLLPLHQRLDIERTTGDDGVETTLYRLVLPADPELPLLQLAARDGVLVAGVGPLYFEQTLDLLRGGDTARLLDSARFHDAFAGLPVDVAGRRYLDVARLREEVADLGALADTLGGTARAGGLWQGLLGDALDLASQLDTLATTVQVDGQHLVTEKLTRLADPAPDAGPAADASATDPAARDAAGRTAAPLHAADPDAAGPAAAAAGSTDAAASSLPAPSTLAGPTSGELLAYVPADVLALEMRGPIDLARVWRHGRERLAARSATAENVLWAFDVAQAAVDLSLERDLLSWLGSEHVSITLPARRKLPARGQTDTVLLFRLDDPDGARKCLARLEAVWQAAAPRLLEKSRELLQRLDPDLAVDVRLVPAEGLFRSLRRIELDLAGLPFPITPPPVTFGVLGKLLVVSTSPGAIESVMAVAAGEEPGLEEHPFAAVLLQQRGVTSAHLAQRGQQVEQLVGLVRVLQATFTVPIAQGLGEPAAETFGETCVRVRDVLAAFDFLGDEVAWQETRDGGRVRYERATLRLRTPAERPFHRPPGDAPPDDAR